jgi:hypothetical protein
MSDTTSTRAGSSAGGSTIPTQTGWTGWIAFAGVIMIMLGVIQAIHGLVALFNDEYYAVGRNGLAVSLDFTTWGWIHLILGLVLFAAGFGVMVGQWWARALGVIVAGLSALVNFAFLAAYPVASAIVIAIDVLVIWALTVHGKEMKPEYGLS